MKPNGPARGEGEAQPPSRCQQAEKLESLTVMAVGVAHDFNNYLAAILGNNSIVLRSLPDDSPARENARQIESTALLAIELTREIITYSARGKVVPQVINLRDLFKELADLLEISVCRNVELDYRLADELPLLEADATQVRDVIIKLVMNASDSLLDCGGKIVVSVSAPDCDRKFLASTYLGDGLPEGRYVCIEVKDSGCGMSDATRARMYEPFYSSKIRGRGMGLAIVIGILRAHRGTITAHSEPGKGTTVKAFFPCPEE
jgi:signal transduction histidine kinase